MMDEREFNALADAMLLKIEQTLEQCGADIDFELKAGGVLEIEVENGTKVIINRHTAAREIWVAAKSGGYHFKPEQGLWLGTRDGEELVKAIARCLSEQTGEPVTLR
jgi:CyaY protein